MCLIDELVRDYAKSRWPFLDFDIEFVVMAEIIARLLRKPDINLNTRMLVALASVCAEILEGESKETAISLAASWYTSGDERLKQQNMEKLLSDLYEQPAVHSLMNI